MSKSKKNAKRPTPRRWTDAERAFVRKNWKLTSAEIAKALKGRTASAVQAQVEKL
jgi:hypothetical protein